VWYNSIAGAPVPEGGVISYRDYDPPDELKGTAFYQANGYVLVDAEYMSVVSPQMQWAKLTVGGATGASGALACADISNVFLAEAPSGFKLESIWRGGSEVASGSDIARDWGLLALKVGVVDNMFYWDGGWQPNTDNFYVTLIVLEKSGETHYVTFRQGMRMDGGTFAWNDGSGYPGNDEVAMDDPAPGDDPPGGDNPPADPPPGGDNPPSDPPPADPPPGGDNPPADPPPGGDNPPAYDFMATVYDVKPETLNLKSQGEFTLFIEFPEGYGSDQVDPATLRCSGAYAIQTNVCGPRKFSAKFYRQDLLDVPTGDNVVLMVVGRLLDGTSFFAYVSVRVIG